jgi:hypothetical protein
MNTNKDNFNLWFKDIIESFKGNENAGFAILMITFPLLERFIRSKKEIPYNKDLNPSFYEELTTIFHALKDNKIAKDFWTVYRHGILHQASFSLQDRKGNTLPDAWLSGDTDDIEIHPDGSFWINPVKFSQKVIDAIQKEFKYFEALNPKISYTPIASAQTSKDGIYGTASVMQRVPPAISNRSGPITISIDDIKKKP